MGTRTCKLYKTKESSKFNRSAVGLQVTPAPLRSGQLRATQATADTARPARHGCAMPASELPAHRGDGQRPGGQRRDVRATRRRKGRETGGASHGAWSNPRGAEWLLLPSHRPWRPRGAGGSPQRWERSSRPLTRYTVQSTGTAAQPRGAGGLAGGKGADRVGGGAMGSAVGVAARGGPHSSAAGSCLPLPSS